MQNLKQYVNEILKSHSDGNDRIFSFEFDGQKFWLKRIEKNIKGGFLTKIFKPNPYRSFTAEIKKLEILNEANAPVPKIVLKSDEFFVIEDVGEPVASLFKYSTDEKFKYEILLKAARALAGLHALNFAHGRPALRDIAIKNDEINFLDFESKFFSDDLELRKCRDLLVFIHELYRQKISNELVKEAIDEYVKANGSEIYEHSLRLVVKFKPLYYLLRPFKFLDKKDLNAAISTFELLLPAEKSKITFR
ncbi:phosphotransferase [Campylobacter concisus]|uniref:phosphotransferase n=1 Tax=Campylobacter concisus TaxID=199 RepID=UPI00122C3629|nr:phosphotransferase [Campylobacter concisus]